MAVAAFDPAAPRWPQRRRVLPGFGLTLGITVGYLGLIVLIPLLVLFIQSAAVGRPNFLPSSPIRARSPRFGSASAWLHGSSRQCGFRAARGLGASCATDFPGGA